MILLLLAVAVAALAWLIAAPGQAASGPGRRVAPAALLTIYLLPALALALVLWGVRDQGRLRFALLGVGFAGAADQPFAVEVGGDRDAHGLWLSAFDGGGGRGGDAALGQIRFLPPAASGSEVGTLRLEPAAAAPGLFGRRVDGALQPVRSVLLEDGDRVRRGEAVWTVETATGLLGPPARLRAGSGGSGGTGDGEVVVELPRRRGALPAIGLSLPIWRAFEAAQATYPWAWLAVAANVGDGAGEGAGEGVDRALAEPPRTFFFQSRQGFVGSRLWLASSDPAVSVERGGEPVPLPAAVELEPGERIHALSPPRWDGQGFRAGGVRDRRSWRLLPGRRSFAALYDTPEVYALPWSSLEELAVEPAGDDEVAGASPGPGTGPLRVHLSMGGWQITDRSLYFRHTSRKVALESLATLTFARRAGTPGLRGALGAEQPAATFGAATPRGAFTSRFGEPLWLGGEHLAAVQIDVLHPPVMLGLLALLLALAKAAAARAVGFTPALLMLAGAVESLVAIRLLLGYRTWMLPPFSEETLGLALAAWTLLPWGLLIAAWPVSRGDRHGEPDSRMGALGRALPLVAGWLFSLAWCWRFAGGADRATVWILAHLLVLAIPLARWLDLPARLAAVFARRLAWPAGERRVQWAWLGLALVPAALRIALLLIGFRESLPLGQRFALSLLHVPLALVIEAGYLVWLWRRVRVAGRWRGGDLLPALGIVAGSWLLPALVVSDLGLALLNVPVFLLALVAVSFGAQRRLRDDGWIDQRRRAAWLPATALLVLAVFLVIAALPLGARALLLVLPENESERNYLRLLAFAYPRRIEEVARRGSEELAVMAAVMRSYTSGPFAGRGYLASEISPQIRATALREHVPAVFVAGSWGLAGALALLLLYATAAGAGLRLLPPRGDGGYGGDGGGYAGDDPLDEPASPIGGALAATAGGLAALTLAVPSLYMLLATYRLTVFTGKNAYLLGLDSTADVLESLLLATMAALGAAVVRDREEEA